jgi:hypothetical protein
MGASLADSSWWLSRITRLPKVRAFLFDLCIHAGILALIEARGAARPKISLFWRADFVGIGWFHINNLEANGNVFG